MARDTENRFIYDLGSEQWDIPELKELLTKVLSENRDIESYQVTRDFPHIGKKTLDLSARRLFHHDISTETILVAIRVVA